MATTAKERAMVRRIAEGGDFPDIVKAELPDGLQGIADAIGKSRQLVSAAMNGREYGEAARAAVAEALGVSRGFLDKHLDAYVATRWGTRTPWRDREREYRAEQRRARGVPERVQRAAAS